MLLGCQKPLKTQNSINSTYIQTHRQRGKNLAKSVPTLLDPLLGSILGPLLFTLYMSDLPHAVKHCEIESFVDDTKLYLAFSAININVALSQINQDLHRSAAWCCVNQLLINPGKTKFIIFCVPQLTLGVRNESIDFLGTKIAQSSRCRDLGIILDSYLTFNNHINSLSFIAVIDPLPDKSSETSLRSHAKLCK